MQSVVQVWNAGENAVLALPPWQALLVLVGGSLVVAWLVRVGGDTLIRRLTRRIDGDVDDAVFTTLHPAVYVSVVLVGAFVAVRTLGLAPDMTATLRAGTASVLLVVWAVTLTRLGRRVSRAMADHPSHTIDQGHPSHLPEHLVGARRRRDGLSVALAVADRRDAAAGLGGDHRDRRGVCRP
ncbi:MAG: hypothetical protein ABEI77_05180 [Halorientalis sp.]